MDAKKLPNANDPFMINPRNVEVRVPEHMVAELKAKGFRLVDPNWKPLNAARPVGKPRNPAAPLSRYELESEIQEEETNLETIEL